MAVLSKFFCDEDTFTLSKQSSVWHSCKDAPEELSFGAYYLSIHKSFHNFVLHVDECTLSSEDHFPSEYVFPSSNPGHSKRPEAPPTIVWNCSECGDGPYLTWQVSCQACGHDKCGKCNVYETP